MSNEYCRGTFWFLLYQKLAAQSTKHTERSYKRTFLFMLEKLAGKGCRGCIWFASTLIYLFIYLLIYCALFKQGGRKNLNFCVLGSWKAAVYGTQTGAAECKTQWGNYWVKGRHQSNMIHNSVQSHTKTVLLWGKRCPQKRSSTFYYKSDVGGDMNNYWLTGSSWEAEIVYAMYRKSYT